MNNKGQSIFSIILILTVVFVLIIYLMPFFNVASDIASNGQTGIYGFFVTYFPYFIVLFLIVFTLWRAYAG